MLIGDDRQCAKDVNAMMAEAGLRIPFTLERLTEIHRPTFFFGHYDSRGGGTLVRAKTLQSAAEHYNTSVNGGIPTDDPDFWDFAGDDYEGRFTLLVCDKPLPDEEADIHAGYAEEGEGWFFAKVESRYAYNKGGERKWSEWREEEGYIIAYQSTDEDEEETMSQAPKISTPAEDAPLRHEYRLTSWDPGEDAYGLIWTP